MAWAVNVVFSPGGKVYSFDPNGLELAWDERVICGTSRGPEIARVVTAQPRGRALAARPAAAPDRPPRDAGGRGSASRRTAPLGRKAMLAFRDLLRERGIENARPVARRGQLRRARASR